MSENTKSRTEESFSTGRLSAYDANGNTLSDPSGKSYSWDFENRLTQAVVPGTGTVTFKYDPFGRRIQKSSPSFTSVFLYDGPEQIEEIDNSSNVLARYTHGPGIDELFAESRSGTSSFYDQDGLGSVTSLSNSTGTLVNTYTYDSFGNITSSTGTVRNPFHYTGREFDAETGIDYYRARYYDPNIGRFVSEDPIRFRAGDNFYEYVKSNPVAFKDGYGLECTQVGQHQLTPWIPTATIISATTWIYVDYTEIDNGIGVVRCRWERTETVAHWGSALFELEYRCTDKLPCGLALEYTTYDFEWRTRPEGQRTKTGWTGM